MKDLMNTSIESPEWTFTANTTPDEEYVTDFMLWRNGAHFATIPAEAEGTPYADQESGLKALCAAANAHSVLTARLFQGDCLARSFLSWAAQMRSVGRTLPGFEARENEARGFLTLSESETSNS